MSSASSFWSTGAGLFGYVWYTRPTTLTIAVGSLDGEAPKLMSALASRLAATNAPVRLKLVETTTALEAAEMFSSDKADLAVVRGDVGDLSQAQAVVILAHAVVLLVAPPGSSIADIAGLKRVTVGVVGGETNRKVVSVLTQEYDLGRANVTFRNLAPAETRRALETKEVRAVLVVVPLAEKYLALLRGLFPQNPKSAPVLIPIEAAGAIAEKQRAYESFDVPKGTLRGSPPVPSDDLTTLRVSFYVVAKKDLDNDLVGELTEALMKARRDLLGELPMLGQMTAPSTDADAYLPVHPGRGRLLQRYAAEFSGQMGKRDLPDADDIGRPRVRAGGGLEIPSRWRTPARMSPRWIRSMPSDAASGQTEAEAELSEIEREIDKVLQMQRAKAAAGEENALDGTTLNVAAHRLQSLIHDRRMLLAARAGGKVEA